MNWPSVFFGGVAWFLDKYTAQWLNLYWRVLRKSFDIYGIGMNTVVDFTQKIIKASARLFQNKVLPLLEACFDLISSPSPSMGGKITKNLKFLNHHSEGQNIFCPFSLHFQIFHKKLHTFVFKHFWISCFTNQIWIKTNILNMFYLISK